MSPSVSSKPRSWHPQATYHVRAPHGWMNDPCAPGFDASTNTYHLFYQWNPTSCDWGNISWGHYTSRDGLHWRHNGDKPVLEPDTPYDKDGIFTGCFYPSGPRGESGQLTVFYTSVTNLPIHWTLPHTRESEGLSLATSADGGRTWVKSDLNPILRSEPDSLTVTGFRDPYVSKWPAMDKIRGTQSLYGILSGGIANKGPATFLYAISPNDMTNWDYIGTLDGFGEGVGPSPLPADLGLNWECVNFMTLQDRRKEFQILTMGVEGVSSKGPGTSTTSQPQAVWVAGSLAGSAESPRLEHQFSGLLDHGCFYAPNTYEHPVTNQRIAWGWLKEDDLTLERRTAKGWTGHLSLPRELFLYSKPNVVRATTSPLKDIESIHVEADSLSHGKSKTIYTLGIRPLGNLKKLRRPNQAWQVSTRGANDAQLAQLHPHWELEARLRIPTGQGKVGFNLYQNEHAPPGARVYYDFGQGSITVERADSNQEPDISKEAVSGPFNLFITEEEGREVVEELDLRIFCDGDVLEVFANDRFALSTMVYSDASPKGISRFVESDGAEPPVFEYVNVWDLGNAGEDVHPITKL